MPIQILEVNDPVNPMVISKAEYETGRDNFVAHYFLADCETRFDGQDVQIPWAEIETEVYYYMDANDCRNPGIRMVYCYDADANELYLRIQLCALEEIEDIPGTYKIVDDNCKWYRTKNGELIVEEYNNNLYDEDYMNNFYYCDSIECSKDTVQLLADGDGDGKYARMITMPWVTEIRAMYEQNDSPVDATLCFGACSYVTAGSGDAPVLFPHGLVLYLRDSNGDPLLNDEDYIVPFHNKGCDMGTLCPSNCGVYISPKVIPQQ